MRIFRALQMLLGTREREAWLAALRRMDAAASERERIAPHLRQRVEDRRRHSSQVDSGTHPSPV